jgi:hypothetical protein
MYLPILAEPVMRNLSTAKIGSKMAGVNPQQGGVVNTHWGCYNRGQHVGDVTIWWGHDYPSAEWACNNWISTCGNQGGCQVVQWW